MATAYLQRKGGDLYWQGTMEPAVLSPTDVARQRVYAWLLDGLIVVGMLSIAGGVGWFMVVGYVLMRDGLFEGQSLGKRLIGLKVVAHDDQRPCTFADSAVRNFLWVIPIVHVVMGLTGLHDLLHDRHGRHWGDRLAKTQVVPAR